MFEVLCRGMEMGNGEEMGRGVRDNGKGRGDGLGCLRQWGVGNLRHGKG